MINKSHNLIRHMGLTGIALLGHGPGTIADNHNNVISHNEISYCGEIWGSGMGILIAGSANNHIHNNLVHHTSNHAIAMTGGFGEWWDTTRRKGRPYLRFNDLRVPQEADEWYFRRAYVRTRHNLVEYNEVHDTGHGDKIADINCLYIHGCGDGNAYRRNYLHDVSSKGVNAAIRTDDWQFFAKISENVIKDIDAPGIVMKEINDYQNNILINCKDAAFLFKLKWAWAGQKTFALYGANLHRNIMVQTTSSLNSDANAKERVGPFYLTPWRESLLSQPMADNNLLFIADDQAGSAAALAKAQSLGLDPNSLAADPMFVDMENGDFRFKEGSPAIKLGITPITKYGMQESCGLADAYRYVSE